MTPSRSSPTCGPPSAAPATAAPAPPPPSSSTTLAAQRVRARSTRPGSPAGDAHDVGTLIRYCVYPGCHRSYRADVGPADRGWIRLRGLTVLCPDHSTAVAGSTQDTTEPAESHTQQPVDPGAGDPIGGTLPTAHSDPEAVTGHDSDAWETVSGWIWSCRTCLDRGQADSETDARRQLSDHNTGSLPWWRTAVNTVGHGGAEQTEG
ncbi:hypothetical protein [Salinispora arenicola]|uniref:hypothetical protein n=1 Tax=Salinispora arenicola TaxID=168697 RepID=UPI0028BF54C8|nr:hypothetical protein [Salinispora arenicola]